MYKNSYGAGRYVVNLRVFQTMLHILLIPSWYPRHKGDVHGVFFRDQALALAARKHKVGVAAPEVIAFKNFLQGKGFTNIIKRENDEGVVTYRQQMLSFLPRIPYGYYLSWQLALDFLFKKYVRSHGMPDLIHAHSALFAGAGAIRLKKKFKIPCVLTEHSSAFARRKIESWKLRLAKKVILASDVRIAVSPQLGPLVSRTLSLDINDWVWIPNIAASRFSPDIDQGSNAKKGIRFLNLALMDENKGQLDLIEAFARAFAGRLDAELLIGGDGPLKTRLQEKAEEKGVSGQVHFLGLVRPDKVPDLLRNADVVVVASHYETFGLVAAEALMCGTPVVATRCGGPECIVTDRDGLLVPVNDPEEMAKALLRIVDRLRLLNKKEIANRARELFSAEAVGRQLEGVYRNLT